MALTFEESLGTITTVETRRDFATYVPRDGVSLNFLIEHLTDAKLGKERVKTMYDLEAYVLEHTKRWHCSFAELVKKHPTHKQAVVQTAAYFVSFAYATEFKTIMSALDKYRHKQGADDLFVWVSILSINQHFGRKEGENAAVVYPQSWFKKAFQECIPSIKNVLFVMSPLRKPVALQRLWCIYELYLSVSNKMCTLDVILPEDDEQFFVDNLLKDSQSILTYIRGVDAEKAKSSNPSQEQKLRDQIAKIPGGYNAINDAVRERLREWFAHAATRYIEENEKEYKKDMPKYIQLLGVVGRMLLDSGKHKEAGKMMRQNLADCKAYHGDEHEKYV